MLFLKRILFAFYKPIYKCFFGTGVGRIFPLKILHGIIVSRLFPPFAEVDGHRIYVDASDSLGLMRNVGIFEPFETEVLKERIHPGDVVVDIGANIGYYTLIFARIAGEHGHVYAFEPDPLNFGLLKKNVEINGYRNVTLVQKAVADTDGMLHLYLCEENRGDHRIYDSRDNRGSIEIEAVRLDTYFRDRNINIGFIKMDIQGAEYSALRGMQEVLRRNRDLKIATEYWPIGLHRCGTAPGEYLAALLNSGFTFYNIDESTKRILTTTRDELLQQYSIDDEYGFTNLLCVRNPRSG